MDNFVNTQERGERVFVSDYGDKEIWLNVQCGRASAAVVLSTAQAQALIDALQAQIAISTEVAA
jgi:hypothetical protein